MNSVQKYIAFILPAGTYQGQWLRGMRHGYGVRTSAAFGIASHSRGGDGARRPSMSSLQPGVEEPKSSGLSNGGGAAGKDSAEIRGGFVLKSRSDEAPVRRRSLVERTGMKNLIQVRGEAGLACLDCQEIVFSGPDVYLSLLNQKCWELFRFSPDYSFPS